MKFSAITFFCFYLKWMMQTSYICLFRYNLFIETVHKNEQGELDKYRYAQPDDIYLLFNPWCSGKL